MSLTRGPLIRLEEQRNYQTKTAEEMYTFRCALQRQCVDLLVARLDVGVTPSSGRSKENREGQYTNMLALSSEEGWIVR